MSSNQYQNVQKGYIEGQSQANVQNFTSSNLRWLGSPERALNGTSYTLHGSPPAFCAVFGVIVLEKYPFENPVDSTSRCLHPLAPLL